MKKVFIVLAIIVLIAPSNGCRILKHKTKESKLETTSFKNDIKVSSLKVDSSSVLNSFKYDRSNAFSTEEINIKQHALSSIPLELTAKFRLDENSSKGDTAFKLVDISNKQVSITVFKNDKTGEATIRVSGTKGSSDMPFTEMQIKRTNSNQLEKVDTTKHKVNLKNEIKDSVEASLKEVKIQESKFEKFKETRPDFFIWIGIGAVIGFFLWLGFRK
ncbi:hypothetical protein [Pedobacter nototheniae]|uniref:hypothetical protein n=1 Tax=Pedobacter nototheniae TaxID=2488994 RepID=UPI001040C26B|nr:hypothetical protein [Pedobacter nototheniae]